MTLLDQIGCAGFATTVLLRGGPLDGDVRPWEGDPPKEIVFVRTPRWPRWGRERRALYRRQAIAVWRSRRVVAATYDFEREA